MQPQHGPLRISQDADRDGAAGQILLVANVLVGGDQHVEARGFGSGEQVAIPERVPSLRFRIPDGVTA